MSDENKKAAGRAAPGKRKSVPITLRQIAKDSGLSIQTVSYVLGEKAHLFRAETRDRVLASASKLGYRPNASAKAMRSGRFNSLSLLLSNVANRSTLPVELLDGVCNAADAGGMHVIVSRLPDERLTDAGFVPKILAQQMSDGLLINYTDHIPDKMIELIRHHDIPSIWLNSRQENDCVYPDDFDAGYRATRQLIALGHRRIVYVDWTWGRRQLAEAHYSIIDRQAGYEKAMIEARLKPDVVRADDRLARYDRCDAALRLLRGPDRPTAIIAYGQRIVLPITAAVRLAGLKVGVDVSVLTFSDQIVFDGVQDIATYLVPQQDMGEAAVRKLVQRISTNSRVDPVALPFGYREGPSLGPPPG